MRKTNKKEQSKYEKDFPAIGNFNWRIVKLKNMPENKEYLNGVELMGVLLHDNKFMYRGILFETNEFTIIKENPLNF